MPQPRIDIYRFTGRVKLFFTGERFGASPELEVHIQREWAKKKGWKSSWIPLLDTINVGPDKGGFGPWMDNTNPSRDRDDDVKIIAGFMTYAQASGCIDAIKKGLPFAPRDGVVRNLGVGIFPVTSDSHLVLRRRDMNAHAGGLVNEPSGYMCSMFSDLKDCEDPRHVEDPEYARKLVDIPDQVRRRVEAKEFKDKKFDELFWAVSTYPASLSFGYRDSFEGDFALVARSRLDSKQMREYLKGGEDAHFVPLEALKELVNNQGDLVGVDLRTADVSDPRRLPLLDLTLGGLIGGAYEGMTGERITQETMERLAKGGWEMFVHNCRDHIGSSYGFPTEY